MQYNISYREKDKGIQFIISYKDSLGKWKQKSKQGFKNKKLAKAAADLMLDELKKVCTHQVPKEFSNITFGEFSTEYLNHTKIYREVKTIQSTQTVLNKFADLNDLELCKITALDIQKIVDNLTKECLNPNTIRYYLKKLTIIFNAAKNQYNIILKVPTKNIKINKPKEIIKTALTDSEVKNLLSDLKNTKYYLLVFIAVNTGMRIGELLGLTWGDIKNNHIEVTKQWKLLKDGTMGFGNLKTKKSFRNIPISSQVYSEIMKYEKVRNIDNRVLSFKSKVNLICDINKKLKKIGYKISFHELRHTYATKLIANGLDFKTTAIILGHDVKETIKTYSHVNNDMLIKAHALIENIF